MPKLHRCRAGDDRQLVLVFIGTKIFLVSFIGKLPPELSLSVTFGLIAAGVIFSMWKTRGGALAPPGPRQSDAPA